MKSPIITLLILLSTSTSSIWAQVDSIELSFEEVKVDTDYIDVFAKSPNAKFKLNYYHTNGYSLGDRYWYEVVIIDTLVELNFYSPSNDDWDYINYRKQVIIDDSTLISFQNVLLESKIKQKVKGVPIPPGTGYGADRLYIESKDLHIAGGTVYIHIGADQTEEEYKKRIELEKNISTTISGDFNKVFDEIEKLFTDLPMLMKSKNRVY